MAQADEQGVHLLLFPGCFLQGYLVDEQHVRKYAKDDLRWNGRVVKEANANQTCSAGVGAGPEIRRPAG